MNTSYTKTKGEIIGLAWIVLILLLIFASLAGWPLTVLGNDCVPIKQAGAECWLYASKLDRSLDYIYALLAFLCIGNYLSPNLGGRKTARDAVIGVLLLDSAVSIGRALLGAEGVAYAATNFFFAIVSFVLAIRVIRERSQTFSAWLSGVFDNTSNA